MVSTPLGVEIRQDGDVSVEYGHMPPQVILGVTALVVLAVWVSPWVLRRLHRRLRPGDLVHISGGYEQPAPWLGGRSHVEGRVQALLPAATATGAYVVVRLSEVLEVERPVSARGQYAILGLRYRGATWGSREVVAVWLGERQPESSFDPSPSSAVESHATYRRLG